MKTDHQSLLAAGVTLVVIGSILRGLARSSRRNQALRKQRDLAANDSDREHQPDPFDRHLEKYLPRYAAGCIITGLLLVVAAFLR
jgi:hypothetical protein